MAFPIPSFLKDYLKSKDFLNFQVIGARGKGKSTMIRHLLKTRNPDEYQNLPESGSSETTKKPTPYKIKKGIYIWDMPGLGGLNDSNEKHWEDYLKAYGTGHFDRTFLICNANEGINEMELYFLRHLIYNNRFILI